MRTLTYADAAPQVLAVADGGAAGLRPQRAQVLVGGELERGAQAAVLLQPEDEGVRMVRKYSLIAYCPQQNSRRAAFIAEPAL